MADKMADKTEILIINSGQSPQEKLVNGLNQAGFSTSACLFKELSTTLNHNVTYDVLLFNATGLTTADQMQNCLKLAKKIKDHPATKTMRLLLIGISSQLLQQQQTHDFDDLIFGDIRIPSIISRVKAQIRLNTMQAEFNRRLTIAENYECDPLINNPLRDKIENASILITGRPNGYSIIEETLAPIGTLIGTLSQKTAEEYLNRQSFDMVIINGGKQPTSFFNFVKEIRNKTSLITLPILLVAHASKLSNSHIAYEAGFTDIIDAPVNSNELILRTTSLIKEHRFRTSMAQRYLSARHIPTNDALTGLYTYSFYREHLNQLIQDHNKTERRFTLIMISIENINHINNKYGFAAGDKVLAQVSEILMSIIRGEDLASRIAGHKFSLTLPDTNVEHAVAVLKRVEGILKQTEFICQTDSCPISIELSAEIIESNGENSAEALFNRPPQKDGKAGRHIAA